MTPFHTRAASGLRPPRSVSRNVTSEGDTAHYGGPSPWGSGPDRSSAPRFASTASHARCPSIWRAWQAFHMDTRGWVDIAYSSGVCPHGHRYEGRGPGVRTAANGTSDGNNRSLATVYIAGDVDPLTDPAKRAFLDEGGRLARLRWGHRDWKSTACPGAPLYAWRSAGWPAPIEEDDMNEAELRTELTRGTSRQLVKDIVTGAGVDALRPRTDKDPDRGAWRALVADVVDEAVAKAVAPLAKAVAGVADVDEAELAAALLPGLLGALDVDAIVAAVPGAVRAELAAALAADPAG